MMELPHGIPLQADSEADLQRFAIAFAEVLEIAFNATEQRQIANNLDFVRWTRQDSSTSVAYVRRLSIDTTKSHAVFFASHFAGKSNRFLSWMITHELVHVLQFATGYESSPELLLLCKYVAIEAHADTRAVKHFGPKPYSPLLATKGLPMDDDFDRLAHDWRYLSEDQRLELRALSAALAHEAKAAQRAAG